MWDKINILEERLRVLESRLSESGYDFKKIVTSELRRSYKIQPQSETQFGLTTALCVDTIDQWKQNRVRYFCPLFHRPDTDVESLDFAIPVSNMGGFDDSGMNWVPPAGSTLCILFEHGSRSSAYYIGTTWHRNRGPDGQHNWGYPITEYYQIHEGHRKGFLLGANDGSQVLPPWNTESYNGIDLNSQQDFDPTPDASNTKITYPNIYGFKTPQKHMLKMVDGDYKCNHKHKRIELMSGNGNWMLFKDDHLHQFKPNSSGAAQSGADDSTDCDSSGDTCTNTPATSQYFKNQNELLPWNGNGTPQNNTCDLKQSGIQLLSRSGHSWVMDDSVEEPTGIPEWEISTQSFGFGCSNKFTGRMYQLSATGHRIELNDVEEDSQVRSNTNGIKLLSACGHLLQLNDHSQDQNTSGDERGITLQSTSNHTLELYDGSGLQQGSVRKDGGTPIAKAKNAYVALRSGYGLEILMEDANSQENTQQQAITILAPQTDNTERGPHMMRFQEAPSGPGQVFLRAGGNFYAYSYDGTVIQVGDPSNPSDLLVNTSNDTLVNSKSFYVNIADVHYFKANQMIMLGAGEDCPIPNSTEKGPCWGPVLVLTEKGVVASDRIYGSASQDAPCVSLFELVPFHKCPTSSDTTNQ